MKHLQICIILCKRCLQMKSHTSVVKKCDLFYLDWLNNFFIRFLNLVVKGCPSRFISAMVIEGKNSKNHTKLIKTCFVTGISFCIVANISRSFSMFHRTPNPLYNGVFCKSKSTIECFWETPYINSSYTIFLLLQINLVSVNPPAERVLMTSMHASIAFCVVGIESRRLSI